MNNKMTNKKNENNINSFKRKREVIYKAKQAYSSSHREGKGSMADEPMCSLIDSKKQEAFLKRFPLQEL